MYPLDVDPRAARTLVVGEALTDVVRSGESVSEHPGGSPMNVSFGLARLGIPVDFLTRLGSDARGRAIEAHLASAGVTVLGAPAESSTTATATATIDATGSAHYEFDVDWRIDASDAPTGRIDVLHFGSIGAFLEPGATAVAALVGHSRDTATITYDPNIRAQFLPDHPLARAAVERHVELSDVVKASDEDLAWLYPDRDPAEIAARWLSSGPSLVVITTGSSGSIAQFRGGRVIVPARAVEVADTIGAGDSFMSGLIAGLHWERLVGASRRDSLGALNGETVTSLVERATLCAAITVGRHGALPPTLAELDAAGPARSSRSS
jgi:fructokinase